MDQLPQKKTFIEKLRELPDSQKQVVFFTVIGLVSALMIILGIAMTKNSLGRVGGALRSAQLPSMDALHDDRSVPDSSSFGNRGGGAN